MLAFQNSVTQKIAEFLTGIGISIESSNLEGETVLPGIRIAKGAILVDESKLTYPADILHEAGHLAVVAPVYRKDFDDNNVVSDEPASVVEVYAMAWSYTAALQIGISISELFHDGGYHGRSNELRMMYSMGVYLGVQGLVAAGMTITGDAAGKAGVAPYPAMIRWVRE
jgi:hypothetical protein